MSLKLGNKTTIVVSSPSIVKQVLQKNDQILSSRTILNAIQARDHHKYSMAWLPVSAEWHKLRKISKEQMFSAAQLDSRQNFRQEKFKELREYLHLYSFNREFVNIGKAAFTTSLNLISTTMFSKDFATYDSNSSQELKEIVWGILENIGTPNITDYFPVLKFLDPQGIFRQTNFLFEKIFDIFDGFINERLQIKDSKKNDFLQALLDHSAKNESDLSRNHIKHMLLDFFVAGTDTTSATVEWAMAELLRNPKKMEIARAELHQVMGKKEMVNESDISRLPYLQAIVKETFRLHPAAPLLLPHKANADVEISGYIVPENAHILVNAWASGRDSETWLDPETFSPERFFNSEIDAKGQHFELIPFGAGRRICPGMPLDVLLHTIRRGRLIRRLVGVKAHAICLSSDGIIIAWNQSLNILSTYTLNGALIAKSEHPLSSSLSCMEVSVDGRCALVGLSPSQDNDNIIESSRNLNINQATAEKFDGEINEGERLTISVPSVCFFDMCSLKVLHTMKLDEGQDITALALNKDNTNLIVSTADKQLIIFTDPTLSLKVVDHMLKLGWEGEGLSPLIK
ncbi:hypothetical protein M9H77_33339 [Catharanthus roseus]|uniref:Uncharacterized protein n=1 Tax=Catharanthus roseus TaxID=4058 RepID=A0ACB9ZJ19_CATRO|nr:hypothetical protein M9H77_33339 [Catharanthus roseus]